MCSFLFHFKIKFVGGNDVAELFLVKFLHTAAGIEQSLQHFLNPVADEETGSEAELYVVDLKIDVIVKGRGPSFEMRYFGKVGKGIKAEGRFMCRIAIEVGVGKIGDGADIFSPLFEHP